MKIKDVTVDIDKENVGDWVQSPRYPDVWAKVRGINNVDFRRSLSESTQKSKRMYGRQPVPSDVEEKIVAKAVVKHILLDIRGLEDDDGEPIKYDPDFGMQIMTKPEFRNLADFVVWAANTIGEQLDEEMEDDLKN